MTRFVAAWTVAKPDAISEATLGVVTVEPQRATWTGSVTVRWTWRSMPEPEYQRLEGVWFCTTTATTFGVPSVCATLEMS